MKKILTWLTIFSFVLSIFPAPNVLAQPQENPGEKKIFLAVLGLDCKKDPTPDECSLLSESLREQLLKSDRFRIVDRKNMDQILKEQGLRVSETTLKSILEKGKKDGSLREVDNEKVAYILDSLIRSFHYLYYLGLDIYKTHDILDSLTDLILLGLKAR